MQDKKENFAVCLGPAEEPDTRMPTPRWPAGPAGFKVAVTVRASPPTHRTLASTATARWHHRHHHLTMRLLVAFNQS